MIRILICAATQAERAALAAIVRGDPRFEVAGETTPRDVARNLEVLQPDVVLEEGDVERDLLAPTVSLVDAAAEPWTAANIVTDGRAAYGILRRDAPREQIAAALAGVAAGLVCVQLPFAPRSETEFGYASAQPLTVRESQVLVELARGVPNKTIAVRLAISEHTVKYHVASVFAKLGVANRTEAVTQAVRLGLVML